MSKKNITAYRMSQITGLSESTFSKWKAKPTSKIPVDSIQKIAKQFNLSINELLGETETTTSLSDEEKQILESWDKLDETGKLIVRAKIAEELRRLEK